MAVKIQTKKLKLEQIKRVHLQPRSTGLLILALCDGNVKDNVSLSLRSPSVALMRVLFCRFSSFTLKGGGRQKNEPNDTRLFSFVADFSFNSNSTNSLNVPKKYKKKKENCVDFFPAYSRL